MIKTVKYIFISLSLLILSSCEKEFDMKLEDVEPKIVVEGGIKAGEVASLHIRYTQSYMEYFIPSNGNATPYTDGKVYISDSKGNKEELTLGEDNLFTGKDIIGEIGQIYTLTIDRNEGSSINASCKLLQPIEINEVNYNNSNLHLKWQDPAGEKNFYRLKIAQQVYDFDAESHVWIDMSNIYLFDDNKLDGEMINYTFDNFYLMSHYSIKVEMMSITEEAYHFYKDIRKIYQEGNETTFLKAPGNPSTNLGEEAAGFFNAYSSSTKILVLDEDN